MHRASDTHSSRSGVFDIVAPSGASAPVQPVQIELSPRALTTVPTLVSLVLVLLSYGQDLLAFAFPTAGVPHVWRFDVDVEASLSTWFSSGLILVNALLLGLIAKAAFCAQNPWRWHWLLLALIFMGLSIDESLSLHEAISGPTKRLLGTSGLLHFAWVVPLMAACVVGFIAYLPFIMALDRIQRARLLAAAGLFLAGAVGVEMVGGAEAEAHGFQTLTYRTLTTLEEALEMIGMLAFLNFLLHELSSRMESCRLRVGASAGQQS